MNWGNVFINLKKGVTNSKKVSSIRGKVSSIRNRNNIFREENKTNSTNYLPFQEMKLLNEKITSAEAVKFIRISALTITVIAGIVTLPAVLTFYRVRKQLSNWMTKLSLWQKVM